jgi:adenylate kinase family enzyme
MNPKTFIFFGRAGCGKGTQAKILINHLESLNDGAKVIYIETGAKLREFVGSDGPTQKRTGEIMAEGGLLPSFLPIWIWTGIFIDNIKGKEHIILDGLSRQPYEAPVLHNALKFYGRSNPVVIVLNISNDLARQRSLNRGRADDKTKDIDSRLAWYDSNVVPTIEFFRKDDYYKVLDIDGSQTVEKVNADIIAAIS